MGNLINLYKLYSSTLYCNSKQKQQTATIEQLKFFNEHNKKVNSHYTH